MRFSGRKLVMGERAVNWLVFTCLIGLIPVFSRLMVWANSNGGIEAVAVSDLVAFGLVLHASNINEVNTITARGPRWRAIHNGFSALFLVLYSLPTISLVPNINLSSIRNTSLALCVVSFMLSFSIFFERHAVSRGSA
jgi:hypothetical protein